MNWQSIVYGNGDALRWPSDDINYYRDLILLWPFLLFLVAGITNLLTRGANHGPGLKLIVLALAMISIAKEKRLLLGGALGFCAWQSMFSFVVQREHDWRALATSILTGVSFLLLIRACADYQPSYRIKRGSSISVVALLVGLVSLGLTLIAFRYL